MGLTTVGLGVFMDEDGDGFGDAGETMNYSITIRNTGNVRIGNIFVATSLQHDTLECDNGFENALTSNVRYEGSHNFNF